MYIELPDNPRSAYLAERAVTLARALENNHKLLHLAQYNPPSTRRRLTTHGALKCGYYGSTSVMSPGA